MYVFLNSLTGNTYSPNISSLDRVTVKHYRGSYGSVGTAAFTDENLPLGGISAYSITLYFENF